MIFFESQIVLQWFTKWKIKILFLKQLNDLLYFSVGTALYNYISCYPRVQQMAFYNVWLLQLLPQDLPTTNWCAKSSFLKLNFGTPRMIYSAYSLFKTGPKYKNNQYATVVHYWALKRTHRGNNRSRVIFQSRHLLI